MKDKRFLELVNTYLDGEISEAETMELEREIRSSTRRMDQYRRYCRMQKACMVLAEESRVEMRSEGDKIVRLPEARRTWLWGQWWRGGVYGGTAAIAATVILVISMSGPTQVAEVPAAESAGDTRTVQVPVGEFSMPAVEPRLASLTDRWSALSRIDPATFPTSMVAGPRTPEFAGKSVMAEWSPTVILPMEGPLEFRYRTDSFSGARVLNGQALSSDAEAEFTTFPFAP